MQHRQVNKPISVNLDKSKKYLSPTEAFYMLNRERNINGTGTLGKTTPLVANYQACEIIQPAGDNYTVGHYFSDLTNELYWWVWNSNRVHYIARLNGDGNCEIVYDGPCLLLSADPKHSIEQWRVYLKYDRFCAHQGGKQLIWTDGLNPIGMIDVEASIATNSFTTPFFDTCPNECAPVQMCVPEPFGALQGEFVELDIADVDLNNYIVDVGIKVRFRHIYYDQRASEWSDISSLYYQDSRGCFDASEGFPRCLKFRVPIGNPLVDKIEFALSTDNGATWVSTDLIEKYEPYTSTSQYWYERDLLPLLNFSDTDCAFDYIFCNDKQCNPIDPLETSRVYNPMPRQPQGMFRLKDSLAFYNYIKGNCPLDGAETEKMEIGIDCTPDNCIEEFANVTVRAIVWNPIQTENKYIFRQGGSFNAPDDPTDIAYFANAAMGQQFKGKVRNFIAYIEGMEDYGEMKQYQSDAGFVNTSEVGVLSVPDAYVDTFYRNLILSGNFFYQEKVFKVRKGTKGFIRLASHKSTNGLTSDGQDTSTQVTGILPDIHDYNGDLDINSTIDRTRNEIYFDACAGDVVLDECFVIDDLFKLFETGSHTSCAYSGYITDQNNRPIENAEVWYNGSVRSDADHNGFYFFPVYGDDNNQTIVVEVRVETNCVGGFNTVKALALAGGYGSMCITNIQITDADAPGYKNDFYEIVNVPVKDCDNNPIGGIRVAISGSKFQVSDAVTGIATFNVRNVSTRNRSIVAAVVNEKGCFSQDCTPVCNPCMPSTASTALSACFSGKPTITVALGALLNKISALLNRKGLKAGGRYGWGIVAQGNCGRLSAVYPVTVLNGSLAMLDNYMNIPKTQEKGTLNFCGFTYDSNSMVLPDWVECVKIVRTENLNNFELQWVVDKIERTADRKIKLTIQSLNDYNATYNFETNTIYQYAKNDRVEFITNGDGTIFDTATYGLLNYQVLSPFSDKVVIGEAEAPAQFFNQILIDDDGKLDNLEIGAKIELQRPKECTVEPTYFEILSLDVIEISGQRVLANPTGTFTSFDTYIVNRDINGIISQQFEHKFPSDFWGQKNSEGIFTGLSDVGKVHFENKFENEKRYGRNVTINSVNQFNRFGDLEKTLDAPEQGDLIAMFIWDAKIGLGIGEFDNFLFQISDEFLRLGTNGLIQAAPADSLVSDTQPKVSGRYGCRYQSIGSIYFGDGWVTWLDVGKSSFVKHDFSVAKDISEGKFNTWVKKRVQFMESFNSTAPNDQSKYRCATGYNYFTNALQFTIKALTDGGIYNEQAPLLANNDSILIEPRTEELLTFPSYTPEAYSNVVLNDEFGCAFVCFLNGNPYVHPILPLSANGYNQFFGVAVDSIVGIAINASTEQGGPDKIKVPLAAEIQDEICWFAVSILTDKTGFESEIPRRRWKKTERKWDASFLYNKNARGQLYGTDKRIAGERARGYFIAVTFIRDNTINEQYNSIDNAKRVIFDELDLIITKSLISEQSGYTENI